MCRWWWCLLGATTTLLLAMLTSGGDNARLLANAFHTWLLLHMTVLCIYWLLLARLTASLPVPADHKSLPPLPSDEKDDFLLVSKSVSALAHMQPHLIAKFIPPSMPREQSPVLNLLLAQFFQSWLSAEINAKLTAVINHEFSAMEERSSKVLNFIQITHLDIGRDSPQLNNLHILPSDPARNNELEMAARFVYMGGFTAELHLQLQLYTATIEASLRVTLLECLAPLLIRLSTHADHDLVLTLTLTEDPQITLDIQSALANYKDVPMIKQVVEGAVKYVLARMMVEPNGKRWRWAGQGFKPEPIQKLEKQIISQRKKKRSQATAPVMGRLYVTVHEGIGLPPKDATTPDYILAIQFNRQTKKTKSLSQRTPNPKWAESFIFDVTNVHDHLLLTLLAKGPLGRDDVLAHTMLEFGTLPSHTSVHYAQPLIPSKSLIITPTTPTPSASTAVDSGLIRFDVMFEPFDMAARTVTVKLDEGGEQFCRAGRTARELVEVVVGSGVASSVGGGRVDRAGESGGDQQQQQNVMKRASTSSQRQLKTRGSATSDPGHPSSTPDPTTQQQQQQQQYGFSLSKNLSSLLPLSRTPTDTEFFTPAEKSHPTASISSPKHMVSDLLFSSARSLTLTSKSPKHLPLFILSVFIRQARGLVPCDNGGSDPYCVVSVMAQGQVQRRKTQVVKRSLSPLWNERVVFSIMAPIQTVLASIGQHAPDELHPSSSSSQQQQTHGQVWYESMLGSWKAVLPEEVVIDVYDWNRFTQHLFLGQVVLDLRGVRFRSSSSATAGGGSGGRGGGAAVPVEIDVPVELTSTSTYPLKVRSSGLDVTSFGSGSNVAPSGSHTLVSPQPIQPRQQASLPPPQQQQTMSASSIAASGVLGVSGEMDVSIDIQWAPGVFGTSSSSLSHKASTSVGTATGVGAAGVGVASSSTSSPVVEEQDLHHMTDTISSPHQLSPLQPHPSSHPQDHHQGPVVDMSGQTNLEFVPDWLGHGSETEEERFALNESLESIGGGGGGVVAAGNNSNSLNLGSSSSGLPKREGMYINEEEEEEMEGGTLRVDSQLDEALSGGNLSMDAGFVSSSGGGDKLPGQSPPLPVRSNNISSESEARSLPLPTATVLPPPPPPPDTSTRALPPLPKPPVPSPLPVPSSTSIHSLGDRSISELSTTSSTTTATSSTTSHIHLPHLKLSKEQIQEGKMYAKQLASTLQNRFTSIINKKRGPGGGGGESLGSAGQMTTASVAGSLNSSPVATGDDGQHPQASSSPPLQRHQ